jgi:hypothetical protein
MLIDIHMIILKSEVESVFCRSIVQNISDLFPGMARPMPFQPSTVLVSTSGALKLIELVQWPIEDVE